jgi:hypothetical protein
MNTNHGIQVTIGAVNHLELYVCIFWFLDYISWIRWHHIFFTFFQERAKHDHIYYIKKEAELVHDDPRQHNKHLTFTRRRPPKQSDPRRSLEHQHPNLLWRRTTTQDTRRSLEHQHPNLLWRRTTTQDTKMMNATSWTFDHPTCWTAPSHLQQRHQEASACTNPPLTLTVTICSMHSPTQPPLMPTTTDLASEERIHHCPRRCPL